MNQHKSSHSSFFKIQLWKDEEEDSAIKEAKRKLVELESELDQVSSLARNQVIFPLPERIEKMPMSISSSTTHVPPFPSVGTHMVNCNIRMVITKSGHNIIVILLHLQVNIGNKRLGVKK